MKNFTEWSQPEKPKGLEGIKQELSEAYREFGDKATGRPQRKPQAKPQSAPEPKADEFAGFAGMEPSRLDALRGLADRQLNPGARADFLKNALANFQKQQAKPAEAPAPEPAKPKLSLKPDTKLSTKAKATAPEPEDEDKVDPDLERRAMAKIADIRNPKAKRKAKGKKAATPHIPMEMGDYMEGFDDSPMHEHPFINEILQKSRHFNKHENETGWFINEGQRRGTAQYREELAEHMGNADLAGMTDPGEISQRMMHALIAGDLSKKNSAGEKVNPILHAIHSIGVPMWSELQSAMRYPDRFGGDLESARSMSRMYEAIMSPEIIDKEWGKLMGGRRRRKVIDTLGKAGFNRDGSEERAFKRRYGDKYEEILEQRAKDMFTQYMYQGGRDGYVGSTDTIPLPFAMLGADHIVDAEDEEYWRNYSNDNDLDPEDWFFTANSPLHNFILTRKELNEQTKKRNDLPGFFSNLKEFYGDGGDESKEAMDNRAAESYGKAITRKLRDDLHHGPILESMKEFLRSGQMTPEVYDQIVKLYQQGRSEILGTDETTGNFSSEYKSLDNKAMNFNENTDLFRFLGEAIRGSMGGSSGPNFGIMANEMVRPKTPKQRAGWYGFGLGTSPSNAYRTGETDPVTGRERGEYMQHSLTHPSLDYYKDVMYQLSLQGDYEQASNYHTVANIVGNALAAGGTISSKDWSNVVRELSKHAKGKVKNFKENFDLDQEADAHMVELARRLSRSMRDEDRKIYNSDGALEGIIPTRDKEGVDKLFGPGFNADKAQGITDFIKTIVDETNLMDVLRSKDIMGSQLPKLDEAFIKTMTSVIIEGKIRLT